MGGKVTALAICCLLLASCSVGPKYSKPSAASAPQFKELTGNDQWKTAAPSDAVLRGDWWELFGDPKLGELEKQVAVSNQSLKQAQAQFEQARALVMLNRANYYPVVATSPSITTTRQSGSLATRRLVGGGTGVFTDYSFPFGASWEPNLWGRLSLARESAETAAQASAADLENARLSLQAELAGNYFALAGLDMEQRVLHSTITAYERALKLTIDRFNGGVASRADVLQARTQLDTTRAQTIDLTAARGQFEHAIAVLTGQTPAGFSLPVTEIKSPPPPIPVALPAQLLERRPDIAAAERRVAQANAGIGLARVAFFPSLSLSATAGVESSRIGTWISWPSRFFSLGPSAAETLLDFGRRRAQNLEAQAVYDATVAGYRGTVLGAFQEVEDSLINLRVLAQEAVQQEAAVKSARESLELETERYKAGTVSYLDVITSQTILLTNERAAVQILQRRLSAAVQLVRALGGGWTAASLPKP